MHDHRQQVALRIYHDVALTTLDLLTRIVTAPPPFSAVFTVFESILANLGSALRLAPLLTLSLANALTHAGVAP